MRSIGFFALELCLGHLKPCSVSTISRDDNRRFLLSEQLDDRSFRFLLKNGLWKRCSDICANYESASAEIERRRLDESSDFLDTAALVSSEENESAMALDALKEKAQSMYPYVRHLIHSIGGSLTEPCR